MNQNQAMTCRFHQSLQSSGFLALVQIDEILAKKQFGEYTIISSIFVIYAVFYYLKIILMNKNTDDPSEIVIKDPNIFLSIFFWVLFFIYSIYF